MDCHLQEVELLSRDACHGRVTDGRHVRSIVSRRIVRQPHVRDNRTRDCQIAAPYKARALLLPAAHIARPRARDEFRCRPSLCRVIKSLARLATIEECCSPRNSNIDSRHTDHLAKYTAPGLVLLHSETYSSQSATRTFHNCSQKRSQKNSLSHSVLNTAPTIDKELIKRNHRRNIHIIVHYPASDGSSGHCQTPRSIHDVHGRPVHTA